MIAMVFVAGGGIGLLGALATLGLSDAGWSMAILVYFLAGYALPLLALAANLLRDLIMADQPATLSSESSCAEFNDARFP
jgi:hypothetical protein